MSELRLSHFTRFLQEYFKGGCGASIREIFLCYGDPASGGAKDRGPILRSAIPDYIKANIGSLQALRRWNIFLGVGFSTSWELSPETMLYDRVSFDVDCEREPQAAVDAALRFAKALHEAYGTTPLVFTTGFKGARVIVPLAKPIRWEAYTAVWKTLRSLFPKPELIDPNMCQWNRVDRVPLTFNVKKGEARFCSTLYPRSFTWLDFTWEALSPLEPSSLSVKVVEAPQAVKPRLIAGREKRWVFEVVRSGLPDGRKRFMLKVLVPYLLSRGLDDNEVLRVCKEFIANSEARFGRRDKIYDSWIRSTIKSAKTRGFRGFSLTTLRTKDPELYNLILSSLQAG